MTFCLVACSLTVLRGITAEYGTHRKMDWEAVAMNQVKVAGLDLDKGSPSPHLLWTCPTLPLPAPQPRQC